jgi:hypothetical protein
VDGSAYANEYVLMIRLVRDVDDALKISDIQEFCDSTFLKSFMTGAGAALGAALADK